MALSCRIVEGEVLAPNNKPSRLYSDLKTRFGEDIAMEFYALTESLEYKDMLGLTVDKNGEMPIDEFLRFALATESDFVMTKEATEFLQKFSEIDIEKLQPLYNEGIFQVTQKSLSDTGLFSQDEIIEVLYSFDKQQALKAFVETFEGLDVGRVEDFRVEEQSYNRIGMKPLRNPEMVQEDVVRRLQGVPIFDLELAIEALPYPSVVQAYKDNEGFRRHLDHLVMDSKVVSIEEDPSITLERLYNTMDIEALEDVSKTVRRISDLNDKNFIVEEFETIIDDLIVAGVEIDFDEANIRSKSVQQLKAFSQALQDFVQSPTDATARVFSEMVDEFSEVQEDKVVTLLNRDVSKFRFFDSNKDEIQAFEQNSLIRHADNVYQKVDNKYNLEQLYEYLYQKVIRTYDASKIPSAEGSYEKLIDPVNKAVVMEDIKTMVRDNTRYLPFTDIETQEKITVYKMFYNAPIEGRNTSSVAQPIANQEYLEGQFISDFNKEKLSEKRDDTELYNNFYKHFKVDHKGIRLNYQNDFSIATVLANAPDGILGNLLDYSKISKHLDLGQTMDIDPINADRLKAQQYPETVKKLDQDYQIAEIDEVITEETEEFINIRGEVYEKVLSYKDKNLYKKLPKEGTVFSNTNTQKPISGKSPSYLKEFVTTKENTVKSKQYLTKQELADINQKHFECG